MKKCIRHEGMDYFERDTMLCFRLELKWTVYDTSPMTFLIHPVQIRMGILQANIIKGMDVKKKWNTNFI